MICLISQPKSIMIMISCVDMPLAQVKKIDDKHVLVTAFALPHPESLRPDMPRHARPASHPRPDAVD